MSRSPLQSLDGVVGGPSSAFSSVPINRSLAINPPSLCSQTKSIESSHLMIIFKTRLINLKIKNIVTSSNNQINEFAPFVNISQYGISEEDNFHILEQTFNLFLLKHMGRHFPEKQLKSEMFVYRELLEITVSNKSTFI